MSNLVDLAALLVLLVTFHVGQGKNYKISIFPQI
jgi:hypothetical protein